jgi:lipopolysaccharide biosynthesis glycosyltransferase
METFRIFIGYDARETVAYHVLAESIRKHASKPVSITPLVREQLWPHFNRERGSLESTDFAFSRFMVPWLCGYQGHALFMDCDMLVKADVCELFTHAAMNGDKAVFVCQHDYTPKTSTKFLGQQQTVYPRKNWSSVMLLDTARCRALSPDYVSRGPGSDLHRFAWLPNDRIGALPLEWNWLVGEYEHNDQAKILHYTLGGPWFKQYWLGDHAQDWLQAWRESMCLSRADHLKPDEIQALTAVNA